MATTRFRTVDEYLAAQPVPARRLLQRVRALVRKALPGVRERISYQMPMFELDGVMILYLAGFQHHWSLYPATPHVVAALGPQLADRVHHKATVRFDLDAPVPARLVTRFAKARAAEVAERAAAKPPRAPRR